MLFYTCYTLKTEEVCWERTLIVLFSDVFLQFLIITKLLQSKEINRSDLIYLEDDWPQLLSVYERVHLCLWVVLISERWWALVEHLNRTVLARLTMFSTYPSLVSTSCSTVDCDDGCSHTVLTLVPEQR